MTADPVQNLGHQVGAAAPGLAPGSAGPSREPVHQPGDQRERQRDDDRQLEVDVEEDQEHGRRHHRRQEDLRHPVGQKVLDDLHVVDGPGHDGSAAAVRVGAGREGLYPGVSAAQEVVQRPVGGHVGEDPVAVTEDPAQQKESGQAEGHPDQRGPGQAPFLEQLDQPPQDQGREESHHREEEAAQERQGQELPALHGQMEQPDDEGSSRVAAPVHPCPSSLVRTRRKSTRSGALRWGPVVPPCGPDNIRKRPRWQPRRRWRPRWRWGRSGSATPCPGRRGKIPRSPFQAR